MKGLYDQCKQCYASVGRRLQAADSVSQVQDTRELFFMDVARGKDHITLIDFELWLEKAKKAGEKTGTTGNMTAEAAFKKCVVCVRGLRATQAACLCCAGAACAAGVCMHARPPTHPLACPHRHACRSPRP
jgi:hypothetical protein